MEGKGPKDPPRKGGEILLGWLSLGSLVALAPQGCFAVSMAPSSDGEEELWDLQKGFVRVLMWRGQTFYCRDATSPVHAFLRCSQSHHTHAFWLLKPFG